MYKKNVAVFLDRDGVICEQKDLLCKKKDLKLISKSAEAIKFLNENNYRVIVITNQPVVARGFCSEKDVQEINKYMKRLLKEKGAYVDKVYYCPHHLTRGVISKYAKDCNCRKPKPGMILQAKKEFNLEQLSDCYMVGDTIGDIKAGELAGCKTILVKTGYGGKGMFNDAVPMFKAENLYEAVTKIILKQK